MSSRLACLLLAASLAVALFPAGATGEPSNDRPYLGPADPGGTWVPSRPRPKSVLWAFGDGADGGTEGKRLAAMLAAHPMHRLLYLGDVYPKGSAQDFQQNYAGAFGALAARTAPVIGNHEWQDRANGYIPYWTAVRGAPAPMYYDFSVSGWQLLALNTNAPADPVQLQWLHDRIAATPRFGSCRIAVFHHPRYSASTNHGDAPAVEPLWAALAGHARLALSGHDHTSQRLQPSRGITQFVAGTAGTKLYGLDPADPRLAFGDIAHHAALRLALRPGRAVAAFVSSDGARLDRSRYRCKQGRPARR